MPKIKKVEHLLEYQNYIETPPIAPAALHAQACSADGHTVNAWKQIWIDNAKKNHELFGPFRENSIGQLYEKEIYKPVIVAGSGPSLKNLIPELQQKGNITLVSCLHNFHFMEDNNIKVDYYVTLDAGEVTIEEVYEGGSKTEEEYWEISKDKTLLAFIGTSHNLLKKWKGKILFFNCPIPDQDVLAEYEKTERFFQYVSTGGNVLGAAMYIAKAYLAANPIAFVGADFCFSYDKKFHGWESKYDKNLGHVLKLTDVFGNKVLSWQSYANFKGWFEWVALVVPGIYINCSEGGTFGSYPDGNIMAIKQMDLTDFINMYGIHNHIRELIADPTLEKKIVLF